LAKIALELERALTNRRVTGAPGLAVSRVLARGNGWTVSDVLCTSGPKDRPFEEQHTGVSIAAVVAGTFQYRGAAGRELMSPGSLLLGNPGAAFECGHEHAAGDRCVAFHYEESYFERIAVDAGVRGDGLRFKLLRLPPLKETSPWIGRACAALEGYAVPFWEELGLQIAASTLRLIQRCPHGPHDDPPSVIARLTRTIRMIESNLQDEMTLGGLAKVAGLSPYHFLRTFSRLTGLTPHQFIRRARLREVAVRLAGQRKRVLDIAMDTGFGDISNFNRAFHAEFGVSPRKYRQQLNQK
jgi:AraC family transcriptional regulator